MKRRSIRTRRNPGWLAAFCLALALSLPAAAETPADWQALQNAGADYNRKNQYPQAIEPLQQALKLAEGYGDEHLQIASLRELGSATIRLFRMPEAIDLFGRALALQRHNSDVEGEADSLYALGHALQFQNRPEEALGYFEQALPRFRTLGNRLREAQTLMQTCSVYARLGEAAEGVRRGEQAVALGRELGDSRLLAAALGNLGNAEDGLGYFAEARRHFEEASSLARQAGDVRGQALNAKNIGRMEQKLGNHVAAATLFEQSIAFYRQARDRRGEATVLQEQASLAQAREQASQAESYHEQARAVFAELGDLSNEGLAFGFLAGFREQRGDLGGALDFQHQALARQIAAGVPEERWPPLLDASRLLWRLGRRDEAVFHAKLAAQSALKLRRGAQGLGRELQRSLAEKLDRVFEGLAAELIEAGQLEQAEYVLRLQSGEAAGDELLLSSLERRWSDRLAAQAPVPAAGAPSPGNEPLSQQVTAIVGLLAKVGGDFARAPAAERRLGAPERRRMTAALSGRRPSPDGALVYYVVGDERLQILLRRGDRRSRHGLTLSRAALAAQLAEHQRRLHDPQQSPQTSGEALYASLIKPLVADIAPELVRRLSLVLPADLRPLPFATLHDGRHWLLERYALSLYSSAAPASYGAMAPLRVAAFGSSRGDGALLPLPGVANELRAIVRDGSDAAHGVLPGSIALDDEFTLASLHAVLQAPPRYLHLASHYVSAPDDRRSVLLLGDGSRLSLAELKADPQLSFAGVGLVSLSACSTALNERDAYGRGLESLAASIQAKGAGAVLASLWPVADASTAQLMARFYAELRDHPSDFAGDLRRAQLALLRESGGEGAEPARGVQRLDAPAAGIDSGLHPYYWAPFVLLADLH